MTNESFCKISEKREVTSFGSGVSTCFFAVTDNYEGILLFKRDIIAKLIAYKFQR